jgi:hypothetical protein
MPTPAPKRASSSRGSNGQPLPTAYNPPYPTLGLPNRWGMDNVPGYLLTGGQIINALDSQV